jgi:small subunit ribosomal protein S8
MNVTDPVSDFLTRIRNANMRRREYVDVPSSNLKVAIAKVLKEEGYIKHYKVTSDEKQGVLRVFLKYMPTGERAITHMKRVSKPGRRQYVKAKDIPFILGGLGTAIISTPKGVITGKAAKRINVGGELLCTIS